MAVRSSADLALDYDAEMDVLYASLGPPQAAVSDEAETDILLRYVPPSRAVVGITIVNFRRHFPAQDPAAVVSQLLRKYPVVPWGRDDTTDDVMRSP
jgi:uncharacterized protein YuzE